MDVGAAPIDDAPPYRKMLNSGLCTVVGFEPNEKMLAELERGATDKGRTLYLNNIIGDGFDGTMHECVAPGMNSLLEPDEEALAVFSDFSGLGRVVARSPVKTSRLDNLINAMDMLKIDIQGGEMKAFAGATRLLEQAVCVHTEVSFVSLYRNQPTFGDIDCNLRSRGFVPHGFAAVKTWPISPSHRKSNQLLEADVIYVRDFTKMKKMSHDQIKHLGLIARHCYQSADLVEMCASELKRRA